jgi:UDP-3-O-[3-hydroxymyristoyl] glucosamine N-acyltransferase
MIAAYRGIATRMKGRIDVHVTVNDFAVLVNGTVHGDGERAIRAAKPVAEAGSSDVTFVENERNVRLLAACRAAAVVAPDALAERISELRGLEGQSFIVVQVKDALAGFVAIAQHLHGQPEPPPHGIDPRAAVHPSAKVGADASVFPFVSVGEGSVIGVRCRLHSGAVIGRNCRLGDDVTLHPQAVLYDNTVLGDRVILHAHAVIGADGFGYRTQDGKHIKTPQFGWVEIGDDVEIGAGTTIDRGTFQPTRIGAGTKIDNLVQIGHNCQIGRHNLLVSQVGMAGSSSTGDYVVVAGQAGVADHIHIGAGAVIGARSAVSREVPPGARFLGIPARPEGEQKRILVSLDRLPAVCRDVRRIKRQLGIPDET